MTPLSMLARMGAHPVPPGDADLQDAGQAQAGGTRFAVWAPNASGVAVVGDFNGWDGRRHPMLPGDDGVWECFVPGVEPGALYKFELHDRHGHLLPLKSDPFARQFELPPATASVVCDDEPFPWGDDAWMQKRAEGQTPEAPMSIYEVHAGSWLDDAADVVMWRDTGPKLIRYARQMGFTHIELMPVTEHPFGGSWGYQPVGLFAPTSRYGTPGDFARFINDCHQAGLGVIMDWVPAHFPDDPHGLAHFDGTALFEHADPRQGLHPDWDTHIYNLGRNEVRAFLIASALHWLREFHVDALRVDAVASMLYLDYSREPGQWIPNRHGGNHNLEAINFFRELHAAVEEHCPGTLLIAEESTAWPGVTATPENGGLGFDYKWNMGWMHDTLSYMQHDQVHRRHHHDAMTFGMVYAWSERFILPLSHDEVVHGKGALLNKMPGDVWQRFANLRAYFGFMWGHPGKKLLFMGGETGQPAEWDHDGSVDWDVLTQPLHAGLQRLVQDLNHMYCEVPALHATDHNPASFSWAVADDAQNSVFAFCRHHGDVNALIVSNMTPVQRVRYRIGVPAAGQWGEWLNTDASLYGGSNVGNFGGVETEPVPLHGHAQSIAITLPPLATLFFLHGTAPSNHHAEPTT